ncbi:MAG: DUF47 domain-containing protein [Rhodomicrobium sp.]
MTAKVQIVEQLGEAQVLLPELLAAALEANGRAKVRMTLLQEALAHAQNPASPAHTLEAERRETGLDRPVFESTVKDARALGGGRFVIPGAEMLLKGLYGDIGTMLAPVVLAGPEKGEGFAKRLEGLRSTSPRAEGDALTQSAVSAITSARPGGHDRSHDSEHLLIMDLHKALNRLEAESAVETVAGARVHRLGSLEKHRVEAFMRGLNRTRGLAFGHPGLGTTATRTGQRLIIQNDIGTTDAHVLVIHAEGREVTITYTDIHRARTKFFMQLFDGREVDWSGLAEKSAQNIGKDGQFLLVTGRHCAKSEAGVDGFLEYLGSRLVFMIDWNKARKALRNFVDDEAAIGVLRWAAAHDYGHRGFLELGGAELIYEAVRSGGAGHVPYGKRLDAALGAKETAEFLKHTLRVSSEGLSAGLSVRLLKDEIRARFVSQFESMEGSLFTVIGRHLGVSRMMAGLILDAIRDNRAAGGRSTLADQARRLEHKADALTVEARGIASRLPRSGEPVRTVANSAEDANDILEEAAFLLSLAPECEGQDEDLVPLAGLAEIAVESIAHMIRAVEAAHNLPEGLQADVTDALRAIDAVMLEERNADEALRKAMAAFISSGSDARMLVLRMEIGRALESATDRLAHAAFALRDRVLGEFPS